VITLSCVARGARRAIVAAALVLTVGVPAAGAETPQAYRGHLNAACVAKTPTFKRLEAGIGAADSSGNEQEYYFDYARYFSLLLSEDAAIDASLRAALSRVIALLKSADQKLRPGLVAARARDKVGLARAVAAIGTIGASINSALDAAGLESCGSGQ
jgi:hypothetical protein